jgi:hypothetical protein
MTMTQNQIAPAVTAKTSYLSLPADSQEGAIIPSIPTMNTIPRVAGTQDQEQLNQIRRSLARGQRLSEKLNKMKESRKSRSGSKNGYTGSGSRRLNKSSGSFKSVNSGDNEWRKYI